MTWPVQLEYSASLKIQFFTGLANGYNSTKYMHFAVQVQVFDTCNSWRQKRKIIFWYFDTWTRPKWTLCYSLWLLFGISLKLFLNSTLFYQLSMNSLKFRCLGPMATNMWAAILFINTNFLYYDASNLIGPADGNIIFQMVIYGQISTICLTLQSMGSKIQNVNI